MIRLTLVALLLVGTARAEPQVTNMEDRSWHLLQRQYDGLIRSVQHGLTRHECEFALARAKGEPATDEERVAAVKAKAERDAREKVQAAENKARREQWEIDHPGCGYGYYAIGEPKGCPYPPIESVIMMGSGGGGFAESHSSTDIASAECFQ